MKSRTILIIIAAVILLLMAVGIAYYVNAVKPDSEPVQQETEQPAEQEKPDEQEATGTDDQQTQQPEEPENPESASFSLTEEQFPRVDGAFGMLPMVGEIVKDVTGCSAEEAQKYLDENTHGKTAQVYDALIKGEKDVIFVSEPSDDILRQAEETGVEFEMTGIGYDGFVFLLNKQNPVESLTLDEIRDIYAGEITNWSEVGGEDAEIYALQREANSGSQNLMEKMVMQGTPLADPKSPEMMISAMAGLIDAVASWDNSRYSIGYSIYLYAKEQYVKDNVKFLAINGVMPSDQTIADKSYPLTKVVYAVMRTDEPEGSPARQLVDWLLTDEGQVPVKDGGYVGLRG